MTSTTVVALFLFLLFQVPNGSCLPADRNPGAVKTVTCPNGSSCPDNNTCCKAKNGGYGCCPQPFAVCCPDKIHCCPNDYFCQSDGTCTDVSSSSVLPAHPLRKIANGYKQLADPPPAVKSVTCADGSTCPDHNTCCKTSNGYGCCPKPNAVCCPDGVHCCPFDYFCQNDGTCTDVSSSSILPAHPLRKIVNGYRLPADPPQAVVKSVTCADGTICPDGNTCCKTSKGYFCCPEPHSNAKCCHDGIKHCCPRGYNCLNDGTCSAESGSSVIRAHPLVPSAPAGSSHSPVEQLSQKPQLQSMPVYDNNMCDDVFECSDNYTCCKINSTNYGCCPLVDAVCCDYTMTKDPKCCPKGYTCVDEDGTCSKDDGSIVMPQLQFRHTVHKKAKKPQTDINS